MIISEKLTFGQTYVVQSDGPIKITQTGAHGTLEKVNVTDAAGTAGREVVFTAIDTAATVEVDEGTNWSCVPGFNRGAASVQGGPAELPTDQKTFLQWVTDGKLTFDADGRLKIATSVDATGTFNHDGYASNYTKTVDGAKYTTTVNATEVIVKKSMAGVETVLMHLHDGVLKLGGERVLTEAYDLRRMEQQAYSNVQEYVDLNVLKHVIAGNSVEYIFPKMSLSPVQTANGVFVLNTDGTPKKITSGNTGASVVRLAFNSWPSYNSYQYVPADPSCEFEFYGNAVNIQVCGRGFDVLKARKVTIVEFGTTVQALAADFVGSNRPVVDMVFDQHIELSAPRATTVNGVALAGRYLGSGVGSGNRIANMKVSLPAMRSSFGFYAPTLNSSGVMLLGFKIHKQVLIDLFGSLPIPNTGATITTCCDGADAHIDESGDLAFDDADLAAAADAVQAKGWTLNITPVNV